MIVISESAVEPILLEEAKLNLRVSGDDEDSRITRLIKTARQACEEELWLSLIEKTLEVAQHAFYPPIELPLGPVRSIVSVTYVDSNGADVVLAANQYRISPYASPVVLLQAYDVTWPTVRCDLDSVRVRYTAGYTSADSPPQEVPEPIRQAMHLCIAHWFENREAVNIGNITTEVPLGVRYLLAKFRTGLGV